MHWKHRLAHMHLVVDVLLEADLPADKFDVALDLAWQIVFPPPGGVQGARGARRRRLSALLGIDP